MNNARIYTLFMLAQIRMVHTCAQKCASVFYIADITLLTDMAERVLIKYDDVATSSTWGFSAKQKPNDGSSKLPYIVFCWQASLWLYMNASATLLSRAHTYFAQNPLCIEKSPTEFLFCLLFATNSTTHFLASFPFATLAILYKSIP